jgi:hypothetical protein
MAVKMKQSHQQLTAVAHSVWSKAKKLRPSFNKLVVIFPLIFCVILNALIRPWLAALIGGSVVRSGSGGRNTNRWYMFDQTTTSDHPALTWFLSSSDGAVGMVTLAIIIALLLAGWVFRKHHSWTC